MMFGEFLRQLEPGELVTGRDPTNDSRVLEVDKVSIGRAPRHIRELFGDVGDVHWVSGAGQRLDNGSPSAGVAKIRTLELDLDELVQGAVGLMGFQLNLSPRRLGHPVDTGASSVLYSLTCNETSSHPIFTA